MEIKRPRYLRELIVKRGNGLVKVITGVRRCGKSYLLFNLFKQHLLDEGVPRDHIVEISFDEYENKPFRDASVFYPWIKERLSVSGDRFVFLDEVQLLEDFEEVLVSLMRMPGVDVYVTGSNAKFLSRDIITEFRGRGDEVKIAPLSFAEFMSAYDGDVYQGYEEYSTYGGMPATLLMRRDEDKAKYLSSLFSEIYINDIVDRNGVRNVGDLETVLDVVSSSMGSLTNPKRIADTFRSTGGGPSSDTVRSYIEHFRDAFIIEEAKRFDVKGRKYIGSPFKYYFCDMGLRNARMNFRQNEPTHAMETVLYNELRLRGYGVDVGVVTSHARDGEGKIRRSQLEVDFVCNKGSQRCYIQSAYAIPDSAKLRQEEASLSKIDDSFKKIIVVKEPVKASYNEKGILTMGIFDLLLDENSLSL